MVANTLLFGVSRHLYVHSHPGETSTDMHAHRLRRCLLGRVSLLLRWILIPVGVSWRRPLVSVALSVTVAGLLWRVLVAGLLRWILSLWRWTALHVHFDSTRHPASHAHLDTSRLLRRISLWRWLLRRIALLRRVTLLRRVLLSRRLLRRCSSLRWWPSFNLH